MILTKGIRQQRALRAVTSVSKRAASVQRLPRDNVGHRVPQLTHGESFKQHGIEGMLSVEGFDLAWTQYQGYIVHRLNELTAGTEDENSLTKNILLKYARQADRASLFNHASMAHNNHLFFSTISPNPTSPTQPLIEHIDTSFSSLSSLRSTFLATASAMFGPGFVWLVRKHIPAAPSYSAAVPQLAILTTYLAGSPYPGAHYRAQPVDMATQNSADHPGMRPEQFYLSEGSANRTAGSMGRYSPNQKRVAPGGQDLDVLLGVCTWEHVWLRDWGVAGKRGFLEAWWERIDWGVVEGNMGLMDGSKRMTGGRQRGSYYGM